MALSKPNYYKDLFAYHLESNKGTVILGLVGCSVGFTVCKKVYEYYNKTKEIKNRETEKKEKISLQDYFTILKMCAGKNKLSFILHFLIYSAILSSKIVFSVKLMNLVGSLVGNLAARDFKKMIDNQLLFTLWCVPSAMMNSIMSYYETFLSIKIRKNLTTTLFSKYFDKRNYYKVQSQNIDQIVTEDIENFSNDLTDVYSEILKPFIDIVYLTYLLSQKAGAKNILYFYLYYFIVSTLLSIVRPSFSNMLTKLKLIEGDLRSTQTNIITYKEEIAFLNGESRELDISTKKFNSIIDQKYYILHNKLVTNYNDSLWLKYGGTMTAYCVLMPEIYNGNFQGTAADITNYYTTTSNYMISLGGSIKDIMMVYKNMDKISSSLRKIKNFNNALQSIEYKPQLVEGSTIIIKNITVRTPSNNILLSNFNLEIPKGTSCVITGINGIGKSSLFRSLANVWNYDGDITMPLNTYFIPQKSYFIKDNLYNTISYPNKFGDEEEIDELLELFQLSYLKERHKDNIVDWISVLSGGEKQRLAFVRMLYKEPDFCILDEATSAISNDIEEKIFQILKDKNLTLVSIVHKESLEKFHDMKVTLFGNNQYEIKRLIL